MIIDQYVYFALRSERTTAQQMTAVLGLEPDETTARGTRRAEPAVPVCHAWKIACRAPDLRVDEQIAHVMARLRPHMPRVADLARRLDEEDGGGPAAVLQIVRYFRSPDPAPGLFGWSLDRETVDFLAATGAVLDVDEYDLSD
ncbi:DUF4279 domain-containing protein [Streptomyces sp. NPDC047014]|uniref:DUF4279 domain-containing protein n=1 Tax=Streptomyces sp. NPDC047014 TaxID=3155736 RepID=UPI003407B045